MLRLFLSWHALRPRLRVRFARSIANAQSTEATSRCSRSRTHRCARRVAVKPLISQLLLRWAAAHTNQCIPSTGSNVSSCLLPHSIFVQLSVVYSFITFGLKPLLCNSFPLQLHAIGMYLIVDCKHNLHNRGLTL